MHFKFAYLSLFLFHLKLKRQIRSYTPVVSSETIPNSRTKRAKCTCFQTEKVQKPDPWGRHIPIWLTKGSTPWNVVVTNKRLVNNNHFSTFLTLSGFNSFYTADYKTSCSSSKLACVCMYTNYRQLSPCGHPAVTDTPVPGINKLQTYDWNVLSLLRTLANEDTNSRSLQCPQ